MSDTQDAGAVLEVPRGIRDHNPGNIDRSNPRAGWLGAVSDSALTDPRFEQFREPIYGLRAIGKILCSYQEKDACRTIADFVNRWAPRSENNTDAYVTSVGLALGKSRGDIVDIHDTEVMIAFMRAIVHQENGQDPYTEEEYRGAAAMAQA